LALDEHTLPAGDGQRESLVVEVEMQSIIKIFFLAAALLVAAFCANFFGLVSIPWLDINSVPTYSGNSIRTDTMLKKTFED
jgi:hypothetical protein